MNRATDFLKDKVAIVTGGGRGLGRAMVRGLANAGCNVVVTAAREKAEIDAVAREFTDGRVLALTADETKAEDCQSVVDMALAQFRRLDILVNNAARGMKYVNKDFVTDPSPFWQTDPETWRMIIDTNVNGPFLMARAAVPAMLKQRWGRIINVSMNYETMQRRGFSPYGPSKAALESETVIWSEDLVGTGITVNALLPGGVTNTGMVTPSVANAFKDVMLEPEIMVPPLLWLASDASDSITGKRLVAKSWSGPEELDLERTPGFRIGS